MNELFELQFSSIIPDVLEEIYYDSIFMAHHNRLESSKAQISSDMEENFA